MTVNLYRRHKPNCLGGHAWQSRSSELEERRKTWKRCDCLIHASATFDRKFSRKSTGTADWELAHEWARDVQAAGSWDAQAVPKTPPPDAPVAPTRITIADAIKVYLGNRETANVAPATLRKYRTFTKKVQVFGDSRGYVMLDQFTATDMDVFYSGSTLGIRAKGKMLEKLRTFFRFAANREWISKSPVSPDLKPPIGSSRTANKVPFTDEQLADIIKACNHLDDQKWHNRHGAGVWTGEDLKDFIWLMTYTGLRISDVVLFDMERLQGNEIFLRAKKNGGDVFAWVEDWLRDRLIARAKKFGNKPFMIGGSKRLDTVIDNWRQRLHKVFELAEVGDVKGTPHRFRHTFARILLERGVPVAAVADLMGDTEQVVRNSYNRWVPERQAALTKILKDAFSDKPKLVGLKGGKH